MDNENNLNNHHEVEEILQKKEDLMALLKNNETKLEQRVGALEERLEKSRRKSHLPPKHRMVDKNQMDRIDALFEQAVGRSKGIVVPSAEALDAKAKVLDLSVLEAAKERLGITTQSEVPGEESADVSTEPESQTEIQVEEAESAEAEMPSFIEEAPITPSAPPAEDFPITDLKHPSEIQVQTVMEAVETEVEPETESEPPLEEKPLQELEPEVPQALFWEEETLTETPVEEPLQAAPLFEEEELPDLEEEVLEEQTEPEPDFLWEEEAVIEEEAAEGSAPSEAIDWGIETLTEVPESALLEIAPAAADIPEEAVLSVQETVPAEIPVPMDPAAAMDEFFRISQEEEDIPSILDKKMPSVTLAQESIEMAAPEEDAPALWEEEDLSATEALVDSVEEPVVGAQMESLGVVETEEEAEPLEDEPLFEEEALFEEDVNFEEEILFEDDQFEEDVLFEEEPFFDAVDSPIEAIESVDSLFEEEVMADTEEDLFETEDISAESEKSEDSLFESEEILEEEKNAGTGLGESQPINGQNGAIGTMMGVMPEAEKESTIPRGRIILAGAIAGIAILGFIIFCFFCYSLFNRVDYLTIGIVAIFMILTFDMSTIATMATTVAIMAAYFVMEIYWAGTQGLAFSTSNIFMVIFIPVLLVSSSFFVQMLMAAYCPKNRRE
ncbi:hypothetical protein [Eubacterium aggregans]|uniref:hypothetical protein n=1 Tax=Eubacterium aggregans TaxID=81409 RepID=UPI002B21F460|nr:hypothetical protein [Eubacterium aggregans]